MIDVALSSPVQATLLVAIVLVEAIGLYVGYGVVERAVAPSLLETIENA
ncbi:DUF7512 family protein [Natronobacterium gregoryi]|uniref:Uncharacterized protein n=2 Tax=Natronobacterium gregoryi TaxID=44930 RepID=L0AJW4_NATGS|nr:hypothetical protein [Natronobacterium gregoryi]AFZ74168.1 hypothetical protein Natgr_3034 [Natronobacterium gregoryi SP2]ELY63623.1 hypothetical protein C490_15264 [Natronobacterium gregoryi SP2]SFI50755.1 hypothetical protein SAMN05443661_10154 [Natronobacterium gregoryi]